MNERIRILRKQLGITLEKFGEKVGVTRGAMSSIENGKRNVTDQMFKSICREFNVNPSWLRDGEGEMFTEINKEDQMMKWAEEVMTEEDDSFRRRFVSAIMTFDEKDWDWLREKMDLFISINENGSQNEPTTEELEEEYKKSRLNAARNEERSALNTIKDTDRKAN